MANTVWSCKKRVIGFLVLSLVLFALPAAAGDVPASFRNIEIPGTGLFGLLIPSNWLVEVEIAESTPTPHLLVQHGIVAFRMIPLLYYSRPDYTGRRDGRNPQAGNGVSMVTNLVSF